MEAARTIGRVCGGCKGQIGRVCGGCKDNRQGVWRLQGQ